MGALWPLAVALTARFRGDATLMALIPGGFHNGRAPQTAARPYLVMNVPTEEDASTMDRYGSTAFIQFDTFSGPAVKTSQVVEAVLDRVEVLLRQPLTLDGRTTTHPRWEFRTTLVEEDETRHGLVRYRFDTFEEP